MKWFEYLKKTPWGQLRCDWKEYRNICKELKQADDEKELALSYLVKLYLMGDEIGNAENACLRRVEKVPPVGELIDDDNIRFSVSRCCNFYPVGKEKLCVCKDCKYWERNRRYHEKLVQLLDLKYKRKMYWRQKFENVK